MRLAIAWFVVSAVWLADPALALPFGIGAPIDQPRYAIIRVVDRMSCALACDKGLQRCAKAANKCSRQMCTDEDFQAAAQAAEACSANYSDCLNSCTQLRQTRRKRQV